VVEIENSLNSTCKYNSQFWQEERVAVASMPFDLGRKERNWWVLLHLAQPNVNSFPAHLWVCNNRLTQISLKCWY